MDVFKPIVYIDLTTVFTIVNTLILFFVLKHFLYDKVKKVLNSRKTEVEQIYADAEKKQNAADSLKNEYEQKLADAKQTAGEIIKDATVKAQTRGDEIVSEAHDKATSMVNRATQQIEQDKKKAINEIKNDIADMAIGAASRVVDKEINIDDHRRLIEAFIENTEDIA